MKIEQVREIIESAWMSRRPKDYAKMLVDGSLERELEITIQNSEEVYNLILEHGYPRSMVEGGQGS